MTDTSKVTSGVVKRALAELTGLESSGIDLYWRFLSAEGHLPLSGRGRSAALYNAKDVAIWVLAIVGTNFQPRRTNDVLEIYKNCRSENETFLTAFAVLLEQSNAAEVSIDAFYPRASIGKREFIAKKTDKNMIRTRTLIGHAGVLHLQALLRGELQ